MGIIIGMANRFNNPIKFVASGFPSPADDFAKPSLDLNQYIIRHPSSTFFMKVEGNAYRDKEIYDGDILVVDRSLTATSKNLIVYSTASELRITHYQKNLRTMENFWGVITHIIRAL